ncbi:MAG: prolipoprotein diacylglyceryl transferase family protein [Elusimicrobiota bacterium]|jgi:phosphatidylglycerol:prolipoprotein diacylglycerol transferase
MHPILLSFGQYQLNSAPVFAFLASLAAFLYLVREKNAGLDEERFWALILHLALGTVLGAALYYGLLYGRGPEENLRRLVFQRRFPGGSFFGSFWGAVGLAAFYCRRQKIPFRPVADLLGTAAPLALAVMRIGCLLNGCCYGRATDMPWAVVFRDPHCAIPRALLGLSLHPQQLYDGAGAAAVFLFLHGKILPRVRRGELPPGSAFIGSIALYSALRFLLDFTRGSDGGLLAQFGLSTPQWTSLAGLAAAFALHRRWRKG